MKKTITLYTSYQLPEDVKRAIYLFEDDDLSQGKLCIFDIRDYKRYEDNSSDDSKWAVAGRLIRKFFLEQGETGEVYVHIVW